MIAPILIIILIIAVLLALFAPSIDLVIGLLLLFLVGPILIILAIVEPSFIGEIVAYHFIGSAVGFLLQTLA